MSDARTPRPTRPHEPTATQAPDMAQALAAIVNSSEDAVIGKTVDGVVTSWNEGAARLYGYSAEEIIGRPVSLLYTREGSDAENARHSRAATGSAESGFRCTRLRADGRTVEVVMSVSPIRDESGGITGVASISRPVSRAEHDESRVAALLEAGPDGILCVDARGVIRAVNAQVESMFGYPRAELLGCELEVLLPEGVRDSHLAKRNAYLSHPKPRAMGVGLSLSGRRRDGSVFPVEVSLGLDSTAHELLVIAAVRDVSEQRRMELAARENESRLLQLAESVETVFILREMTTPGSVEPYLYVSAAARTVLGLEPEELRADPLRGLALTHPDDLEEVTARHRSALENGGSASSEHRIIRPDGQTRWIKSTSTVVPGDPEGPRRSVITVEDITDRVEAAEALREAEAAARSANEAKNLFLSRMSHELRTPLNAVLGFGQLLEMELGGTDHVEAIEQILKGGRHLLHLINDVLDIARIEAGETSISREPIAIDGLLREALALMVPLAEANDISLPRTVEPTESSVLADRQRLRQILLNLLSNAIKYNQRGGRVWVESAITEDDVAVSVHDDGPGIRPSLMPRLFTPFDRLGAEGSGVDGTGIGLALTRSLAELMDGTLSVESEPGRGSVFTVTLPRAPEVGADARSDAEAELRRSGPVHAPDAPEQLLLYIEDNLPNVAVVEQVIKLRTQWRLIHAGLGRLGVELARAHRPQLILLDLHLPDEPGAEVLRLLRTDPVTRRLPVAILTADASTQQARRLFDSGADHFLTKPLDIHDLLELLDRTAQARVP